MNSKHVKRVTSADCGLMFAKNPHWLRDALWFVDIHDSCIKCCDLQGNVSTPWRLPFLPGGMAMTDHNGLVITDSTGRAVYRGNDKQFTMIADLSRLTESRVGEIVANSSHDMYVGDMGFDFLNPLVDPEPSGRIIHISPCGRSSVVASKLFGVGGMIITADDNMLIVAETFGHRLTAFDIESDGSLSDKRTWAVFSDDVEPDGICLDPEGGVWVAGRTYGVIRVKDDGQIDEVFNLEQPAFATALGGPRERCLFICTAISDDPVVTRQCPGAHIDAIEV